MPIDFDTDIRDGLFVGAVDAEEPYVTVITDNPAKAAALPEKRILALIESMHGYMTTLLDRDEARLAHYTMSRMLTKFGSGGFVYNDLNITRRGNISNPLFGIGDTFDFQEADGTPIVSVAVADAVADGIAGSLADAVASLNADGGFTGAGFTARAVNGKLEITRAETPAVAEVFDVTGRADVGDDIDGTHWLLDSVNAPYYVWYDTGAGAGDPGVAGRVGIRVPVSTGDTAAAVADATAVAVDGVADFTSETTGGGTITVTHVNAGDVEDPVDVDVGGAFALAVTTQGADRAGAAGWQLDIAGVAARTAGFQTEEVFRNDADRVAEEARQEALDIFLKEARANRLI